MIQPGSTVIIRKLGHYADGETGIVSRVGNVGAQVQMSSCEGIVVIHKNCLEVQE